MRGRIVAQVVLAILAAGCGSTAPQEYTSTEGRYRVVFPGKPKITEQTAPTPVGPVTTKIAATEDRSRSVRMVMFADYPATMVHAGNKDAILEGFCQGWAPGTQVTILTKTPVSLHGHPGRDITFESQPGSKIGRANGRTHVYLVGPRLYQVLIFGPAARMPPETIDGFLNSFALLDPIPGPGGPGVAVGPPTFGPPPLNRPGPPSNPRPQPARIAGPRGRQAHAPGPRVPPAPGPASSSGATLSFYNIPEPASAPIEPDIQGMGSTPADPPPGAELTGLGGSPGPGTSAGGASIRSFKWVDENADVVGGNGDSARSDGTRDQHFRVELALPANTLMESIVITSGGFHRWVTQPSDRYWPIAIFQRGRPIARSHVAQVGVYSGPQAFDLYFNTGIGIGPGTAFELEIVLSIGGGRVTLTSQCKRPEGAAGPLADARPSPPATGPPSPLLRPATPGTGPVAAPVPQPRPEDRSNQRDRESTELPTVLRPSSGGATIVSFDWIDQKEDVVGSDGRRIAPGGGKDEHYRLVMDLPATSSIEEVTITGGGVLRWTTKPSPKFWPVAVLANQELKTRGQSLRVGAFSGRWTFDLYVESHGTVRRHQDFGVEVVVFIAGTRHHLTARCRRG